MNNSSTEFEKWYSSLGGYGDAHKKDLWECWKVSRAALYVELPDSWIGGEMGDDADLMATIDVKAALEQAGVSYK